MSEEQFYAIRRTDGEMIWDEYAWMRADGPDDWTIPKECDHDEATEYEIVLMRVEPVAKCTFGDPLDDHKRIIDDGQPFCEYCDEQWPCEYVQSLEVAARASQGKGPQK